MEGLQRGDPASVGGYQLLGRLGAGGMGQVFLGVSPSGRRVAVKLIHPMHAGTEQFRERFAREIEAARRVGGFHTAPVVDADPQADPPWMVTAYIDGPSLQEAVGRYGPLPSARVRALGAGLAEGLAAIHAHGLIHRDLKPGNVIVAEDGPRIIDFGIARAVDSTGLTSTGTVVGTFSYMSPEQVRGDPVMPASDVFSLGCVLGFAATGRAPFGSDTAATVVFRIVNQPPDLAGLADQELGTLIQACLAKSPEDRPTVRAVLAALTGRGPLPAVAPGAPGGPVPTAEGRDAHTQTQMPLRVPAGTNSWSQALPPSSTAPPGPAPPRTVPPGQPVHARPAGGRPRRRRAALAAAAAALAVLAVVVPVLLTRGTPPAAAGHGPGNGSRASSPATTPGPSSHATTPGPGTTIPARDLTLHAPNGTGLGYIAFSPDGRLLAAGGGKGPLVWNVTTGQLTATLADPGGLSAYGVAFSPDGKLLAAVDGDNNVYLWDVATGTNTATFADPGGGNLSGVAISPDGTFLAAGEGNRRVVMWNVATRSLTFTSTVASSVGAVTFSPDGKLLAAAGTPAFLWDVATGQRYATLYDPGTKYVNDVAFSPDGKILATADVNGNAYLWDIATRTLIATLTPAPRGNSPNQYLDSVAFSPDGTLVAVADSNAHVYLWDVATHALVGNFKDPSGSQVNNVTFSPDGQVLAMSDSNGNLYVRVVSQLIS
jgi:serine/threonine protein kinase/sugar lactone lactonase YvrE